MVLDLLALLPSDFLFFARVVELADTLDLGSSAERRAGSSPAPGIERPNYTNARLKTERT